MGNVVLIVIYNHRYDKNIDKIEDIYRKRFKNIFHLMPFYTGDKKNVIPVYENSYYFQSYISQALCQFYNEKFEHYLFLADDLILNPQINEDNYIDHFKLGPDSCYITNIVSFHEESNSRWHRIQEAFNFKLKIEGAEIKNELPDIETATNLFSHHEAKPSPLRYKQIFRKPPAITKIYQVALLFRHFLWYLKALRNKKSLYSLNYPLVGGYSDIIIISKKSIKEFCHYCGVFAVARLFVEIAIPTSILLSSKKVITEHELSSKGKAVWTFKDNLLISEKYEYKIDRLLKEFPKSQLFIHPIKLSKWK